MVPSSFPLTWSLAVRIIAIQSVTTCSRKLFIIVNWKSHLLISCARTKKQHVGGYSSCCSIQMQGAVEKRDATNILSRKLFLFSYNIFSQRFVLFQPIGLFGFLWWPLFWFTHPSRWMGKKKSQEGGSRFEDQVVLLSSSEIDSAHFAFDLFHSIQYKLRARMIGKVCHESQRQMNDKYQQDAGNFFPGCQQFRFFQARRTAVMMFLF